MIDASLSNTEPGAKKKPTASARRAPRIVPTDGERLMRFRQRRDEAAFREVVESHAALVWGVCWQVLRHREDVEDAFQATFLILARKAGTIRASDSAAGWLYRVAFRTALAAKQRRRRLEVEPLSSDPPALEEQLASIERSEQCRVLLEELHTIADRYRQPLVLCYLEGRSRQEAADELGVTLASVKGRLRAGLATSADADGLSRHSAFRGGCAGGGEMAAAQASAATAPIAATAALGTGFAWPALAGTTNIEPVAVRGALTLAKKGILAMKIAALAKPAIGVLAMGITAGAIALAATEPSGGGHGGAHTTVVQLASAPGLGAQGEQAEQSDQVRVTDIPADDAALKLAEIAAAEAAADATRASDQALADAAMAAADVANGHSDEAALMAAVAAAGSPSDPFAASPPIAGAFPSPAVPATNPAVPTQPALPAVAAPGMMPPAAVVPQRAMPSPPAPQFNVPVPSPQLPTTAAVSTSREALQLEGEYWKLKAQGLEKKAKALRLKAQELNKTAGASSVEALESQSEADLAVAEVKLCELRSQQSHDALERLASPPTSAAAPQDVLYYLQQATQSAAIPQTAPFGAVAAVAAPAAIVEPGPVPVPQNAPQAALAAPLDPMLTPGVPSVEESYPSTLAPISDDGHADFSRVAAELRRAVAELRGENEALRKELKKVRDATPRR